MSTIIIETRIAAPMELCFDLARDVDAHVKTSSSTGERAVAGKTSGLLELGDIVTFGRDGAFVSRQLTGGRDEGFLDYPSQLCVNDKDEAFVADRDNSRVQVFQVIR